MPIVYTTDSVRDVLMLIGAYKVHGRKK